MVSILVEWHDEFSLSIDLIRLVVVHGMNGRRMEKFYVSGSLLMSILLTVPPYAAGQYGYATLFTLRNIRYLAILASFTDGTL